MEINNKRIVKLCLVSASGGHYEQLKQLTPLIDKYDGFFVTEKTKFKSPAKYYLPATGFGDFWVLPKTMIMFIKAINIWIKEKPDYVITTGTYISIPFALLARLTRKKFIYIETFARVYDGTRAGKLMYKFSDLFIIQWETLKKIYPKATYGGSIY